MPEKADIPIVSAQIVKERRMSFEVDVGNRLRNVRESRNLSRRDVHNMTSGEFKESILAMYENGHRRISAPRLKRLADFYSVPIAFFMGEANLPTASQGISLEAALRSDPEFSDEEKELLTHVVEIIKAKRNNESE